MNKFERLLDIETEFDLSVFNRNGIWYYPVIKQNLFVYDLSGNKSTEGAVNSKSILPKLINTFSFLKNSKSISRTDFLILDSAASRRFNPETHKFESLFSDYLYNLFSDKKIFTLEKPNETGKSHYREIPDYVNLIFPDKEILKSVIKSKLNPFKFTRDEITTLLQIISFLDSDINIIKFISVKISRFFSVQNYYLKLLSKLKPKLIFLINAYNYANMALVLAAKKLGITTIELQHGFIREDHPGYIWDSVKSHQLFPDYFFSYGEYFTNLLKKRSAIFDESQIITCGAYSIEKKLTELLQKRRNNEESKKVIYITSQWSIREKLKPFVLKLSDILPGEYVIKYKTHPLEKDTGKFYSEFKNAKNIILLENPNINSLDLMPEAAVHSTAYSTSFMEANFMGIPNIFIYIKGFSQVVEKFVDNQTIFSASTPEYYLKKLRFISENRTKISKTFGKKKDFFYKPNAEQNIKNAVTKILEETT